MFKIKNYTDNDDIKIINELGPFQVLEYQRDLSVMPSDAMLAYYCNEMNVRKRQVVCDLSKANITLQAGAMQWTVGDVKATTGVKGVGDFFSKSLRGSVTGESAIKPEYTGSGILVLEPTYKHILLIAPTCSIFIVSTRESTGFVAADNESATSANAIVM